MARTRSESPATSVRDAQSTQALGTIADLPRDYYEALTQLNTLPLWPSLRAVAPVGTSQRDARSPCSGATPTFARNCCAPVS